MNINDFLFYSNKFCKICLENKTNTLICNQCMSSLEFIDGRKKIENGIIFYPLFYNNFIKEIIRKFKYEKNTHLVKPLSEILKNFIIEKNIHIDYISYIPMYYNDEFDRGYNQSFLLAKELGKNLNIEILDLVEKTKTTKHQNKLSKKERGINLKNSFKFIEFNVILEKKKILIVDDVVTTGSTFSAISEIISENIKAQLIFLAIASSKINDEE